ncbi:sodium:glutamate symporter [Candidatus Saccharibacteria bacterium]|nr:sodium:glutamate symporter [Candidatus Saccharibacteria bacterium]
MHPALESAVVLAIILSISRFIKRGSNVLQRFFIPSALVAGVMGLILGPQVLNTITVDVTKYWVAWPKYLITIVFAGLFLGKIIPSRREVWLTGGPMIAFGNTLAWGQYVIGILLSLLILEPIFGANPLAGALIEISFEGGHGTAAGLAPTFEKLGWSAGTDIALTLATFSIVMAILLGVLIVNIHNWRHHKNSADDQEERARQRRQMIRSGYNVISLGKRANTNPVAILINIGAFALAIVIGWILQLGLVRLEDIVLANYTDLRLLPYLPLFPLAMLGGLILQFFLRKIHKQTLIQRRTAEIISSIALDILIASAVATVSLKTIGENLSVIGILGLAGVAWILFGFIVLAPRMFPSYWYEKGLTNMGQSMGMTATGLLLGRLADPNNRAKARESFAYKQLVFEPFMGGGIVTVSAVVLLDRFGQIPIMIGCTLVTIFWLIIGLRFGRKHN